MTAEDSQARLEYRVRHLEESVKTLRAANAALTRLLGSQERALQELGSWVRQQTHTGPARVEGIDVNDGKPWVCEKHNPVQHRDRRPPWCNACGRGLDGQMVGVPGWLRRLAQEQSPAGERAREEIRVLDDVCGAPAAGGGWCGLKRGHNMGQPDIPELHVAAPVASRREAQP